ncbi:hypothetical protein QBC39DRAFT_72054 [Podospora conica]|nr:hypothetical protein QBC39DRAFT_72054 [Schizothecium conicum]
MLLSLPIYWGSLSHLHLFVSLLSFCIDVVNSQTRYLVLPSATGGQSSEVYYGINAIVMIQPDTFAHVSAVLGWESECRGSTRVPNRLRTPNFLPTPS